MQIVEHPYFKKESEAAPLAVFRILFGLMMLISVIRFWLNGWIEKLYLEPAFHFSYNGFAWIKPLGDWTYLIFIICGLSSIGVMLGYRYRWSAALLFLSFTYIELMDKTTYLNHYYFVSLVSFLMIMLPANVYYSIDASKKTEVACQRVPQWTIDAIKLMLGIVYFYAGLAKLNSDWLFHALPLKIWLPSRYDMPLLGGLFQETWVHFAFSWIGAIYDLSVPLLLLNRKTRGVGFFLVVVFHLLTRALFPIGMFPYIMIASTLIFFHPDFHHKLLNALSRVLQINKTLFDQGKSYIEGVRRHQLRVSFFLLFFVIQLLLPFRFLLYPGELFWNEEGFRFSWRVMLMEKAGSADFKIKDGSTGKTFYVDNKEFLTPFQEKQMAFQPDFILEYAHHLKRQYEARGMDDVEVYVDSYVTLNGRRSARYVDPEVDLGREKMSLGHRDWIIPFKDEIKGL